MGTRSGRGVPWIWNHVLPSPHNIISRISGETIIAVFFGDTRAIWISLGLLSLGFPILIIYFGLSSSYTYRCGLRTNPNPFPFIASRVTATKEILFYFYPLQDISPHSHHLPINLNFLQPTLRMSSSVPCAGPKRGNRVLPFDFQPENVSCYYFITIQWSTPTLNRFPGRESCTPPRRCANPYFIPTQTHLVTV